MRSTLLLLVASAASAVSGSVLQGRGPPNLPASAFPGAKAVSFEEAKARKAEIEASANNVNNDVTSTSSLSSTSSESVDGLMSEESSSGSPLTTQSTQAEADSASCRASPGIRFEWRQYSASDRQALMTAIRCLMGKPPSGAFSPATNRYEDFVVLHQMWTPTIHQNQKFLLWHRYFVWTFEQVLRAECGLDRAFPWWDAAMDAGSFAKNDMFTQPYFGNLLPAQSNGQGWCMNSGAFGGRTLHIGPGATNQDHCMTRTVNEALTAQCNQGYVDLCKGYNNHADFSVCVEGGPHANGHNGIGGVMANVFGSPNDPIFYMLHLFVDHTYRVWQAADPSRVTTLNGNDDQGNPMTLDTIISMNGIRPDVRVRDIIDTLGGTVIAGVPFCYKYNY